MLWSKLPVESAPVGNWIGIGCFEAEAVGSKKFENVAGVEFGYGGLDVVLLELHCSIITDVDDILLISVSSKGFPRIGI